MPGHLATMGETTTAHRMLWRKPLENVHLEDRQEHGRMTLRWILGTLLGARIRMHLTQCGNLSSEDTSR
jgi:hypothetical protein